MAMSMKDSERKILVDRDAVKRAGEIEDELLRAVCSAKGSVSVVDIDLRASMRRRVSDPERQAAASSAPI